MTRESGGQGYPQAAGGLGEAATECRPDCASGPAQVVCSVDDEVLGRLPGRVVAGVAEIRPMAASDLREERDLAQLPGREVRVHDLTVTRHDPAISGRVEQVAQRGGPVERERITERGRRA